MSGELILGLMRGGELGVEGGEACLKFLEVGVAGLFSEVGYFSRESFHLGDKGGYFGVFGGEFILVFSIGRLFFFSEGCKLVR